MEESIKQGPGLVVALTGGIGSGKTSVSDRFAALGAAVIDADRIAHELTAAHGEATDAIVAAFGRGVLRGDGSLDRAALRRLVFSDAAARHRLEAILHPRIRERMQARLARVRAPYAVLVIPLLFETGQTEIADRVLVVDVPESLQVARVRSRSGLGEDEVRRILACQVSREVRLAGADDRIDNGGSREELFAQVNALHRRYLALGRAARDR
jgi:dephospho-CoA kinase